MYHITPFSLGAPLGMCLYKITTHCTIACHLSIFWVFPWHQAGSVLPWFLLIHSSYVILLYIILYQTCQLICE